MNLPNMLIGIWQQPAASFAKWKADGVNLVVGCQEGGPDTAIAWRKAASNLGLFYIDSPKGPNAALQLSDIQSMIADPYCAGIMVSDEPDLNSPWPTGDPVGFQVYKNNLLSAWTPLMSAVPSTKIRLVNFAGPHVVNAREWGYNGEMQKFWAPLISHVCADMYPANDGKLAPYVDALGVNQAVNPQVFTAKCLKKDFPDKKIWMYLECERIQSNSQSPTPEQMQQEIDALLNEGGISGYIWFSHALAQGLPWDPNGSNGKTAWDGRTDAQRFKFVQINQQLSQQGMQPQIDLAALTDRVLTLEHGLAALKAQAITDISIKRS